MNGLVTTSSPGCRSSADARRHEGDQQRIGAVGNRHRVPDADIVRQALFQAIDLGTADVATVGQDLVQSAFDHAPDPALLPRQVDEGYRQIPGFRGQVVGQRQRTVGTVHGHQPGPRAESRQRDRGLGADEAPGVQVAGVFGERRRPVDPLPKTAQKRRRRGLLRPSRRGAQLLHDVAGGAKVEPQAVAAPFGRGEQGLAGIGRGRQQFDDQVGI